MSLTREAIVEQLQQILGDEQVLTDAQSVSYTHLTLPTIYSV